MTENKIMEKIRIPYPVVVEGKYDKITLSSVIDAQIITTDGFGIFKKNEKAALLRRLAEKSEIIVLTDSDGGGKVIRSHLCGLIPKDKLIQLYIPQIKGRERRKTCDSAEGTLGVEGMEAELLRRIFAPYGAENSRRENSGITKTDFYTDGLSGGENSSEKRDILAKKLGLPAKMTANALLAALQVLITYEEYLKLVGRDG